MFLIGANVDNSGIITSPQGQVVLGAEISEVLDCGRRGDTPLCDEEQIDTQLNELQAHYEWDLAAILWPRQMAVYTQLKGNLMALSVR